MSESVVQKCSKEKVQSWTKHIETFQVFALLPFTTAETELGCYHHRSELPHDLPDDYSLNFLGIQEITIALENCKIFTTKTFHRKTYSCLISRIFLHCFVQDYLLRKFLNIYNKEISVEVSFQIRLLHNINIFFIGQLRMAASKCHSRGSIQLSSWKFKQQTLFQRAFYQAVFSQCHFNVTASSLELSHKKQENVLSYDYIQKYQKQA